MKLLRFERCKQVCSNLTKFVKKKKSIILLIDIFFLSIISLLSYIIFFHDLGKYSVRMWDEARNGINAIEMFRNNNFIVTHFNGSPEMWNTKPPLLIWCIVLSFKIFGVNEFALRFPSAIAAFLTVLTIYLFFSRALKDRATGFLSCLILFSAFGFSDIHIGRSGDYDAMLTFLVFIASVFTFLFLHHPKKRFLYGATILWISASLTKGIASVFVVPAILSFILLTKKIKVILNKKVLWAISLFLVTVGGYYLVREIVNSGYINTVWVDEIVGRATKNNEPGTNPFIYYWNWLRTFRFQHFIYFVPFSFVAYFLVKEKSYKNWVLFSYLIVIVYYLVISISSGKNIWYDAQLYPFASILVGILFTASIRKIPTPFWLIPVVVLAFYLQRYIRTNIAYVQRPDLEQSNSCLKYGYLLRQNKFASSPLVGVHKGAEYCMPFLFYMLRENIKTKQITELVYTDNVLSCDNDTLKDIQTKFRTQEIFKNTDGCIILQLKQ